MNDYAPGGYLYRREVSAEERRKNEEVLRNLHRAAFLDPKTGEYERRKVPLKPGEVGAYFSDSGAIRN